ncbi:signal transduction histidine kinase [Nocardioides thalensis]|uniref:histidine kinase n=1 Tax=Nocardioides thalensis TaxID=1914755 RepID=A0A853C451_9ACTN|nr:histidine kinase [Nocardioides thalensis]NYJ02214.1 signal transduction histidine kinase [Nocardioides thalensis]
MFARGAGAVRTDVLLALVVTAVQVLGVHVRGPEVNERPITDLAGLGIALLVLPGLALAVRRRWPGIVLALAALTSGAYYLLDFSDGPGWLALFIALYTVTAYGDGRRSVRIAAITIAALAAVWLVAATDIEPAQAIGWVWFRIGAAVMSAALGESSRARQVILDEAVARAELAERRREEETRARVADERVRIAREVHDTVAHAIAIVNVQAGVTAHVLDKRPDLARENLVAIEQTSSRALEEMRSILGMLRSGDDPRAPTPGLAEVDELVERAREAGLTVDRQDTGPASVTVPSAVGAAAYRIVQEGLTNVIRHVGPTRVSVGVTTEAGELCVSVVDEGPSGDAPAPGAPDPGPPAPGHGIRGMRERCELLGGRLEAGPRAGRGFEVRARIPLALRAEATA